MPPRHRVESGGGERFPEGIHGEIGQEPGQTGDGGEDEGMGAAQSIAKGSARNVHHHKTGPRKSGGPRSYHLIRKPRQSGHKSLIIKPLAGSLDRGEPFPQEGVPHFRFRGRQGSSTRGRTTDEAKAPHGRWP